MAQKLGGKENFSIGYGFEGAFLGMLVILLALIGGYFKIK